MAVKHSNTAGKPKNMATTQRPIEAYINQYDVFLTQRSKGIVMLFAAPALLLGIYGLAWAIPFPQMAWLGKYNGYINWASVIMAVLVYIYYRLSAIMSYGVLFYMFACSYLISQLGANPHQLLVFSATVFLLAMAGQLWGFRAAVAAGKKQNIVKFLLMSPLWVLHSLLITLKVKY